MEDGGGILSVNVDIRLPCYTASCFESPKYGIGIKTGASDVYSRSTSSSHDRCTDSSEGFHCLSHRFHLNLSIVWTSWLHRASIISNTLLSN